ncbi:unnamed protein product [Cochlearia groenlandica]
MSFSPPMFLVAPKKNQDNEKIVSINDESDWFETSFIMRSLVTLGMDEEHLLETWELVPNEKKNKIEEKLKVFYLEEMRLKTESLLHDVSSALAESVKRII